MVVTTAVEAYDVYISSASDDRALADRLARALGERGLRSFNELIVATGDSWPESLDRELQPGAAIVVLWTAAASKAHRMLEELAAIETLARDHGRRALIPLVIGGDPRALPEPLTLREALVLDEHQLSDPGAWDRTADAIAASVRSANASGPQLPGLSDGAARALAWALALLGGRAPTPGRLRSASLIGALLTAQEKNLAPTTGEVARLVAERSDVPLDRALETAANAAGLRHPHELTVERATVEDLAGSAVRELVLDSEEARRLTGTEAVHLRHVLFTGVHPDVPRDVLGALGVTLDEIRGAWRDSLATLRPDEAGWSELLGAGSRPAAPPSARVQSDRWTIDDKLDYALYARAIAEFIRHREAEPPMVISVQAPWGQGKTSLMRMVQAKLDPGHPDLASAPAERETSEVTIGELVKQLAAPDAPADRPEEFRTVWFNAWKYQSSEQIWAGLADAILSQLTARLSTKQRELFWLRLQRKRIDPSAVRNDIHRAVLERFLPRLAGWLTLLVGLVVFGGLALLAGGLGITGVSVAGAGVLGFAGAARGAWGAARAEVFKRPLEGAYVRYVRQPDYASRLGYLHEVEEDLRRALELLTPGDRPTVIFIDDLDRCSPAKVGEVIEAVNLFLAGEFPNCAFVIGIDAEVVAASMEVVHKAIIEKLGDRRGELGWRFMDKFVQLPFVMPRLHPDQRRSYLEGLFATAKDSREAAELMAEGARLETAARTGDLSPDELAQQVGSLAPQLAAVDPEKARALGEEVVAAGAREFSDSDPEVIRALAEQMPYLSDNPRTIKRAVNLYRFHRFTAFARQASTLPLDVATPAQIGRWIVVIIRWPHFVRWLQAGRDDPVAPDQDPAARVLALAAGAGGPAALRDAMHEDGIDAPWTDDSELLEFLLAKTSPELRLDLAARRGLW